MKPTKADRRRMRLRKRAMRKLKRLETKFNFVDHPRYGNQPIRSGESFLIDEVRRAFWQYRDMPHDRKIIFPETAIRADPSKQNYSSLPRRLYVDIARRCHKCGRWFLFFALEQRHWFETLGFYVDADCLECQECRHQEHALKERADRYAVLLGNPDKSTAEWRELEGLADLLWKSGYIRNAGTLQKARMPKRLRNAQ